MKRRIYYVHAFRVWNQRTRSWHSRVGTTTERPDTLDVTIAIYRVECDVQSDALGIVIEWLDRDRPRVMFVDQLYPRRSS